ncbi:MAG: lytic transglycosylase domain-containing protein, partial [Gammaproteobacteria bacterium]
LEVQLARQEIVAEQSGGFEQQPELDAKREKLAALGREYDQYLQQSHLFGISPSEEDRLISSVARIFGECELNMPPSFVREVKRYIKKWKTTAALERAIARADGHGFLPVIQRAMTKQDLPLQFYYLGLRESGFQIDAVGPQTAYGIAKGPWQFIPETAVRYGMATGPLVEVRQFDPADERFNIVKSTYAAARYLKDIYATEAQASGLLVMASYNWGEENINRLLRQMPENPRERNFWELINRFEIPDETYEYVLMIVSAAVIGENPKVFGFDFDDPLAGIKNPSSG